MINSRTTVVVVGGVEIQTARRQSLAVVVVAVAGYHAVSLHSSQQHADENHVARHATEIEPTTGEDGTENRRTRRLRGESKTSPQRKAVADSAVLMRSFLSGGAAASPEAQK